MALRSSVGAAAQVPWPRAGLDRRVTRKLPRRGRFSPGAPDRALSVTVRHETGEKTLPESAERTGDGSCRRGVSRRGGRGRGGGWEEARGRGGGSIAPWRERPEGGVDRGPAS